jgi:hypothetical protein
MKIKALLVSLIKDGFINRLIIELNQLLIISIVGMSKGNRLRLMLLRRIALWAFKEVRLIFNSLKLEYQSGSRLLSLDSTGIFQLDQLVMIISEQRI